jgi:unsaturated rhamnogalacturonyl hydrolase
MSRYFLYLLLWGFSIAHAQTNQLSPIDVAISIGDKLVRETPFRYKLSLNKPIKTFSGLQVVDFGRTYAMGKSAVAYACTGLFSETGADFKLQLEHADGCKIWLNDQLVYDHTSSSLMNLQYGERNLELRNEVILPLKKGVNKLMIKLSTSGTSWRLYMQPTPDKGAISKQKQVYPNIGLAYLTDIDAQVAEVSNWIVVGPFENQLVGQVHQGLATVYPPEQSVRFGYMYAGLNSEVTWTIPKIEVLGDVIDSKDWGTNYNWNYHNGGVAWAMHQLGEVTGIDRFKKYSTHFCDFHLEGLPFVGYQVNTLSALNSANSLMVNTPLLDFTLAPALPFVYRLRRDASSFHNKKGYQNFVDSMIQYALVGQIRLPGAGIYTRTTPQTYTTWVDDMFMGIPFLVQASMLEGNPSRSRTLLNDAASQVIGFNKQVFDENSNLYVHAKYSDQAVKLPHWSRANGWGIWAVTEVLQQLPQTDERYSIILAHYRKHVKALVALQDKSGFWFNVLDRSDSPKEVSGTAIFTMAIARGIRNGWLEEGVYLPIAKKGWEAIRSQVEPDGTVHNICMGTMCSEDVNYYINRPFYDNDTHGLFAVLFASMEMHLVLSGKLVTPTSKKSIKNQTKK